jgi:hypothetical protein
VANQRQSQCAEEIISGTYAWNERKRQFTERQIRLALKVLNEKNWLHATITQ